jgi:DNA-binding response OmpR family regulator
LSPTPQTLLVVDDIEDNRDLLARRLGKRGFRALTAESGPKALKLIESESVDLVLLDIMMPGMSGIEVLRRVRQTRSSLELPVIMVTAKAGSEDVVDALEVGANDYVTKPVDFPVLLARIQAQLRVKTKGAEKEPAPPPQDSEIRPGAVIAGRYRLESRIGAGAYGTVYRATHLELLAPVAVKVLQTGPGASPEAVERFRREGISACRVRHPNAVTVLDFGATSTGVAYLVMEFLEGHSLLEELMRHRVLTPARSAAILGPVCEVLAVAHRSGVIHRDIKPANIFLQKTPVGEVVKVLDFGISKIVGDAALAQNLTLEGSILGTPAYMSPERFGGGGQYGGKSDVYAVGITLFQMLEGRLPFVNPAGEPMALAMMHINDAPPPLTRLDPAARGPMQELLSRVLAKRPADRPNSEVLSRELGQVVDRLGESALLGPVAAGGSHGPTPTASELEIATPSPMAAADPRTVPPRPPRLS